MSKSKISSVRFPSCNFSQKELVSLSTSKERYIIPGYQREYSWTVKEVTELISDINNSYELGIAPQLGNIILITKDRENFYIIDGQQRLTTIFKLVELIRERVSKYPYLKETLLKIYTDVGCYVDSPKIPRLSREEGEIKIPQDVIDVLNAAIDKWISDNEDNWEDKDNIVDYIVNTAFLVQTFYAVINDFDSSFRLIVDYFFKLNTRGLKFDEDEIIKVQSYIDSITNETTTDKE